MPVSASTLITETLRNLGIECDIYDKLRDDEMQRNGTGYGDDLGRIRIQFAGAFKFHNKICWGLYVGLPLFPTCRDQIQALLARGTHCVTLDPPKSMQGTLSKCDGYAHEFADRDSAVFEDRTLVICSDASAWPPIAKLILNIALLCNGLVFKLTFHLLTKLHHRPQVWSCWRKDTHSH